MVLVGFAVLTALLGAVMCLFQAHLKRLLAFATISQVGLAMIGVACSRRAAWRARRC